MHFYAILPFALLLWWPVQRPFPALLMVEGPLATLSVVVGQILLLLTVALILIPKTRAIGALFAVGTMLGALGSHATKIGWSGNAAAESWPLALVVLAAAGFVLFVRRRELPVVGGRA